VKNPTQPADLVSMNDMSSMAASRAYDDRNAGQVIAGHVEQGNEVFTFAIVTIGVMNGTKPGKIDDKTYR